MATIYGRVTKLMEVVESALGRSEPMIDLGPRLMETGLALMRKGAQTLDHVDTTLDRCDRVLDRMAPLVAGGDALLGTLRQNAELTQRKLELEIAALERAATK